MNEEEIRSKIVDNIFIDYSNSNSNWPMPYITAYFLIDDKLMNISVALSKFFNDFTDEEKQKIILMLRESVALEIKTINFKKHFLENIKETE